MAEKGGEPVGKRESHEPGTFSWVDLSTPDAEGAKAFYGGLSGWEMESIQDNGTLEYTTIKNAGSQNGGFMPLSEERGAACSPSSRARPTSMACDASLR